MTQLKEKFRHIPHFWVETLRLALLALAYGIAVYLGQLLFTQPGGIPILWPASGVALAFLLQNPKQRWAKMLGVIFVIGTIGYLSTDHSLLVSVGFALTDSLEAVLGALVLGRLLKKQVTFDRVADIFALLVIIISVSGVTALIGTTIAVITIGSPFLSTWQVWWVSDGLGILLVAPWCVIWMMDHKLYGRNNPGRLIEIFLLVVSIIIFSWLLFGPFTIAERPTLRA
jgi:integral membrane sensor domain MASE1